MERAQVQVVLRLDEIDPGAAALVGGKALRLAELRRAGCPVPDGFVVTALAFEAEQLAEASRGAILAAYAALGADQPVAVRSSALAEDLGVASFAGQYETYLNVVGPEALLERIAECRASFCGDRAQSYRQDHGIAASEEMAVLVQLMVPADAAGVLFTLNPLTGVEQHMVVEAAWGLGEGVVSGLVTPDRYLVDAERGVVRERALAEKRQAIRLAAQGTSLQETAPELRGRATLTDTQLLELAKLGEQIQAHYGAPQDVEWALAEGAFFILQSRPLTRYHFSSELGVWTSANFREVMPGIVTPLSFSLSFEHDYARSVGDFLAATGVLRQAEDVVTPRLFFGRPYWRIDLLKALLRRLPGFKERGFDLTAGIEPTYEGDGHVTPFTLKTILYGLPVLLRVWRHNLTYAGQVARFKRRFLTRSAALRKLDLERFSDAALRDHTRRMVELRWEVNSVVLPCTLLSAQAQDDFHAILDPLNESLPPEERIDEARLMTGLSGMSTARPLAALRDLARAALRLPEVARVIREHPAGDARELAQLRERLLETTQGRDFWHAYGEGYVERFYYLSAKDEDLAVPRWDEDPSLPLALLHSFVTSGLPDDPRQREREQRHTREAEERRVRQLLRRRPLAVAHLLAQLAIVRRYTWWRESSRDMLGMAHYHCRRALLAQGRRWAGGYLEQADDIFWLLRDELLRALAGALPAEEARHLVARRRLTAHSYRNFEPPPIIGQDDRGATRPSAPAGESGRLLRGVPCSPGSITGRARIIKSLDHAGQLQRGEILVAPYTNPGWTPLFALAAALVMEEGGLLSHGAVVAREYGLPTVLQVKEATARLRDGQLLRVDGALGTVEIVGD